MTTVPEAAIEAGLDAYDRVVDDGSQRDPDGIRAAIEAAAPHIVAEVRREAAARGARERAYEEVYAFIRRLGDHMPPDVVHRNAQLWRAVSLALSAIPGVADGMPRPTGAVTTTTGVPVEEVIDIVRTTPLDGPDPDGVLARTR